MQDSGIAVRPIGYVKVGMPRDSGVRWNRWKEVSVVEVDKTLADGLKGLEDFSHIFVIYWMHLSRWSGERLVFKPRRREDLPEVGVFAFRGRERPNPLGLSVCQLVSVKHNLVEVRGLDAYSGTPVLDIKPYDYYDVVKQPRVPWWFEKLWKEGRNGRAEWLGP